MKNIYLFLLTFIFSSAILIAQDDLIEESFDGTTLPVGWTTIDQGDNPGTFEMDTYIPFMGDGHVYVDTYEESEPNNGQANDYLVSPQVQLRAGHTVKFYAASNSSGYPDGFTLLASSTGSTLNDFQDTLLHVSAVPSEYTMYTDGVLDNETFSAGDMVYFAFHVNTNGSGLNIDEFSYSVIEILDESFEDTIPGNYSLIDMGDNPGSFFLDTYFPATGNKHLAIDCYDDSSPNTGQANDYLITPRLSANKEFVFSFSAVSDDATYRDGFRLLASTTDIAIADFNILIDEVDKVPADYTTYEYSLSDITEISESDSVYFAIHVNSNGSWLYIDDISYKVGFPEELLSEDFEEGVPDTWTIIDEGTNDEGEGTWAVDSTRGLQGSLAAMLDTWSETGGPADDWLITPELTIVDDHIFSFWMYGNGDYPDSVSVLLSTSGTNKADFTEMVIDSIFTPGDYTKYQVVLSDSAFVSQGDKAYIAFYCASNGSRVVLDNVRYGKYVSPRMFKGYTTGENSLTVIYDSEVEADSIDIQEFILTGTDELTFTSMDIASEDPKKVMLTASGNFTPDNMLDTLIYAGNSDSLVFYTGILPLSYTNVTNPDGTLEPDGNPGTFKAIIMAKNGVDRVFVSDAEEAYHGNIVYGDAFHDATGEVGDEIIFNGVYSPYENQTEIIDATLINTISSENNLFEPVVISGSDISLSNESETNPAEQYESLLVTVQNATVSAEFDGAYYLMTDDNETTNFYIGENTRYNIFEGDIDASTLTVGESYNITGFVIGRGENYFLTPRNMEDITVDINNTHASEIKLYPVPATNKLFVANLNNALKLELINTSGQIVTSQKVKNGINQLELNISSFESGIYLIRIQSQEKVIIKRFSIE